MENEFWFTVKVLAFTFWCILAPKAAKSLFNPSIPLNPGFHYFLIYKPYLMLSQFSREGDKHGSRSATLADLDFQFAKDVYPVGRLDADSEGLLLLTNDKKLNHRLLDPKFRHLRTYYVQVEGAVTDEAIRQLEAGVTISVDGKVYQTLPARVKLLTEPDLPQRTPPIRFRASIPTSWLAITLHEGKNRQVRKMTATVGFPTLRLVRWAIEDLTAEGMRPADVRPMTAGELRAGLHLKL